MHVILFIVIDQNGLKKVVARHVLLCSDLHPSGPHRHPALSAAWPQAHYGVLAGKWIFFAMAITVILKLVFVPNVRDRLVSSCVLVDVGGAGEFHTVAICHCRSNRFVI